MPMCERIQKVKFNGTLLDAFLIEVDELMNTRRHPRKCLHGKHNVLEVLKVVVEVV